MKSLNQIIIISLVLFGYSLNSNWETPLTEASSSKSLSMSCPNPCQTVDSLALIAIYNATNGLGWTSDWNTSLPVCTPWPGVELDAEGYVVRLTRNNNNLSGVLPDELGNLSRIKELALDNNALSGFIPETIGNLTELNLCFLDNNQFSGSIPEGFGALTQLITVYLDNNNLSGTVPDTFLNLINLWTLDIFNNEIDSIPDLTSMNLQANKFRIYGNNVTFDDIVLNDLNEIGNNYEPQDSVFTAMNLTLPTGVPYTIDLGFDSGISTNIYQWYHNGIPYGGPLTTNKLTFDPIVFSSAGEYRCQVTNTEAPLLTLHTRPVTINVVCGTSVYEVNDTLCPGEERILNFVTYDEDNLTGTEFPLTPDQYGCDSMIVVNLTYRNENIVVLNETICSGDSLWVNGTAYHADNTSGLELLPTPDQYGCDSSLNVNLSFYPDNIFEWNQTICPEDSIIINGTVYNLGNATGTETLATPGVNGCDSIIEVNLSFFTPPAAGNLSQIICPGDSLEILGVILNQTNPSSTITLEGMTANGCDSTLFVEVQFYPPAIGNYSTMICEGGSMILDGEVFNADRTSGQVILEGTAEHGCDSIVNVTLGFFPPVTGNFEPTICFGDSIIFNGTTYNQDNTSGTEILPGASDQGCDSTVLVSLNFNSSIEENIIQTLCQGDSIIVNGVTYNQDNPDGTEMVTGGSTSGCDSTVIVDLDFHPIYETTIDLTLCDRDSIIVNGVTYNADNPAGTEIIENGSTTFCDSTVFINLIFNSSVVENINQTLCQGDSIIINGITYDQDNPNGTEVVTGGSSNGCDSTIIVNLDYYPVYETTINTTLCEGDSIIVNGVTYNTDNPSGMEVIENGSSSLCDSTIFINLGFNSNVIENINQSLCQGDSIIVNGITYNEGNPAGTETIENGSSTLCDSTIIINLTFYPDYIFSINQTLCFGDSIVVNGVTYNTSNPSGTEVIENGSETLCDSTVIINLDFHPEITLDFDPIICADSSFLINGNTYDFDNPTGVEVLENAATTGCDSTVNINLSFYPNDPEIINLTLCPEQGIFINGTPYNESNPSGTEVIENGSVNGCDSTIIITLSFNSNPETLLNPTLCPGDSIVINNVVYNESNPNGIQYFENEAANGCDSIVNIDLSFYPFTPGDFSTTLCPGDSVIVNGVTYNLFNSTGIEIIENGSWTGCDSILNVSINFFDAPNETIRDTLCTGDEIIINNIIYNAQNPNGTELFSSSSQNGCDSVVVIDLFFKPDATLDISEILCPGDSIIVNGISYNESNPSGNIVLEDMAANGCDSIINIALNFYTIPTVALSELLCQGDSIIVNGTPYYFDNPTGTELIENGASNGCDSIIDINLSFYPTASGTYHPSICEGDSILYNGVFYHADNLTGTTIFENASINGCDSIVQVQLEVFDITEGIIEQTICVGDTLLINGTAYHSDHLSGTEILESVNGCDSILQVLINFHDPMEGNFTSTICSSDTIEVNGTPYYFGNESGIEILENASSIGCDSTLFVTINFTDVINFDTSAIICQGDLFVLATETFSETGFYEILLEGASSTGCDSLININLLVETPALLGAADAGEDFIQCENFVSLNANLPTETMGLWTSLSEMNVSDPHSNNIEINNLSIGENTFIWTLSSTYCSNYDRDTVQVFVAASPNANDDLIALNQETNAIEIDLLENDETNNIDAWTLELMTEPESGLITEIDDGLFSFERSDIRGGEVSFEYQICNEECPDLCSTARVRVILEQQDIDLIDIPNAITPNDDGLNEYFMFPHLEYLPENYPDRELIIFNRWGDIVYEAKPYNNDWHGEDQSGKALPQGTYYYVLRLDINNGLILKGDVSILK